ncbi:MAG: DUF2807 domain-containing protein [Legionellales bacterium]|nr:DUF2807 domain-containing protein [Legionellales bacterium]
MKKIILIAAIFISGITLLSYSLSNASIFASEITGNNKIVTQSREIHQITQINMRGKVDVILHRGKSEKMRVIAESNLQKYVKTSSNKGILNIDIQPDVDIKPNQDLIVDITLPKLEKLNHSGSGNLNGKNIYAKNLMITSEGMGKMNLSGKIDLQQLTSSGSEKININGINAKNVVLKLSGSGEVYLAGKVGLTGLINEGSKNITIKNIEGQDININTQGSGQLILSGKAQKMILQTAGDSAVHANDLVVNHITVRSYGSALIQVNPQKSLTASVAGSGKVVYKTKPQKLNQQIFGSGEVVHAG